MTKLPALLLVVSAPLAVLAAGCGSDPPPPANTAGDVAPPPPPAQTAAPAPKQDTAKPTSGSIRIDDKILKACGDLPTARFAFDSTSIQGEAATALDALARCFVSGPLKGKGLKLIGHADPRGETEYNLALGQKRAGSVAEYLATKGLEQGRIATSSKGEFESSGTDEEGWARDRKVDILLAE
ncbi:ompA-family exported protein [Sorangium cellulosum]|uniref:OmpA-family exported protein n=2 Tax=Sorangium cellulosum TaxID=56 RepID=A0A2L0EJQ5_SORCE|nr:ompA-family exported protein [Sorangium cellulosum]